MLFPLLSGDGHPFPHRLPEACPRLNDHLEPLPSRLRPDDGRQHQPGPNVINPFTVVSYEFFN